jgi:hypothetical protein
MRIDPAVFLDFDLDPVRFEQLLDTHLRPSQNLTGFKLLREKARNEDSLREAYRGRAPYELLQNANDTGAKRALFVLTPDGVAFAHDGPWFTVRQFKNLAEGWSDKDAGECIGHKGLGFRSVLDVSPSPFVAKIDQHSFFGIKFSWSLNHQFLLELTRADPEARLEYEDAKRAKRNVCPIMMIPAIARKSQLGVGAGVYDALVRGVHGKGFTTLFWLPARDLGLQKDQLMGANPLVSDAEGLRRLGTFLREEAAVLLPFLPRLQNLELHRDSQRIGAVRVASEEPDGEARLLSVEVEADGESTRRDWWQYSVRRRIPPHVRKDPQAPRVVVDSLREANLVLSMPVQENRLAAASEPRFHVYFPTEESTGLGVLVHGDFHVEPNRTHLVDGTYNDWLVGEAASLLAGRFLTETLRRFDTRSVLEVLAPRGTAQSAAARHLIAEFTDRMSKRVDPFVPTRVGLVSPEEVALAPEPEQAEFWDEHFTASLLATQPELKAFLLPAADTVEVRAFLALTGVQPLQATDAVAFCETSFARAAEPAWWYRTYVFLATDAVASRIPPEALRGRLLVPTEDGITPVPVDSRTVLDLPPEKGSHVPAYFAEAFRIVDQDLAADLLAGSEDVLSWARSRLQVTPFQAADLLPKAVRSTAGRLFSGDLLATWQDLLDAWSFLHMAQGERLLETEDLWADLGRFPVPLEGSSRQVGELVLAPAFLTYWPDEIAPAHSSVDGVPGLKRLSSEFFFALVQRGGRSASGWTEFFTRAGVAANPRILGYARVLGTGAEELSFLADSPARFAVGGYSGDRQADENTAIARVLAEEGMWHELIAAAPNCAHDSSVRVLRSLGAVEALHECVSWAKLEWAEDEAAGKARLWKLIGALPNEDGIQDADTVYCRGGQGHQVALPEPSYFGRQLDHHACFPSTHGPRTRAECFVRLDTQPFVSRGRADEPLGDWLLPFVVADSYATLDRIRRLGLTLLDDTADTSASARLRALFEIGERLSTEAGQEYILSSASRWRLVRGTIQEIYRRLNQSGDGLELRDGTRLAIRSTDSGVAFKTLPVYYAEPGSAVERAFRNDLPLLDVDRRYGALFAAFGIIDLTNEEHVREKLLSSGLSTRAEGLHRAIVADLAPHLLSAVVARSTYRLEPLIRRLKERFEVRVAPRLEVEFTLHEPYLSKVVEFNPFYLARTRVQGPGAIQELHFTLYVLETADPRLETVDGDALGVILTDVLLDEASADVAAVFPRIVSRYQKEKGDVGRLRDYLHEQLGISEEAQDAAWAAVTGEQLLPRQPSPPPPPPPPLPVREGAHSAEVPAGTAGLGVETAKTQAAVEVEVLLQRVSGSGSSGGKGGGSAPSGSHFSGPTPEQVDRGRRGEEEFKRRLLGDGGWDGFTLVADRTKDGCGYDFDCQRDAMDVKVEVKTFTRSGQVVLTVNELGEAANSRSDYYMIGLLDDGGPTTGWKAEAIRDPWAELLSKGRLKLDASLTLKASDLFLADGSGSSQP